MVSTVRQSDLKKAEIQSADENAQTHKYQSIDLRKRGSAQILLGIAAIITGIAFGVATGGFGFIGTFAGVIGGATLIGLGICNLIRSSEQLSLQRGSLNQKISLMKEVRKITYRPLGSPGTNQKDDFFGDFYTGTKH